MGVTIHREVVQGSDAWYEIRRGKLTASEMKLIITAKTLKVAENETCKQHIYELAAQRISEYVEPTYVGDEMLRGRDDEVDAAILYAKHYAPLQNVGFITNDRWGFTLGYSPDGLVGEDGAIEVKSRRQKYQIQCIADGGMQDDFAIQVQTGLLVSERKWIDFISYSGGLPMAVYRILPDERVQAAIIDAATVAEAKIREKVLAYENALKVGTWIPTERRIEEEMI